MFTFIPSQYPDDGSIVPHQRNHVQVCEVIFLLAQFWSRLYEMLCKEGIFPVAGLKVTDSTWQIIKCSFSSIFVQIPKIWPDLKFQITNIGQQGGQLVQLSDVLCLILNQNILHLVKFVWITDQRRKTYEYIRANFFGPVPISRVYLNFRRCKKKLNHILIMFWKIVAFRTFQTNVKW